MPPVNPHPCALDFGSWSEHSPYKANEAQHAAAFSELTPQELAVLALVAEGMTNRQIAVKLYLGEGTVRNYVSSVLAKISVANRAEATAYAVKNNIHELIPPSKEEK
jgi:DNA-binding NarL/FixJ family response regulator